MTDQIIPFEDARGKRSKLSIHTTITHESDFYFWMIEYLHKMDPVRMYPKALADAADLAPDLIANGDNEEEALPELVPGARLLPCCGPGNQALVLCQG